MQLRSIVLVLTMLAIAALAVLNWGALSAPVAVSLGVTTLEAPLGLVMLGLTALLAIVGVAYVLSLQGSVLLETRRHTKELQAQRELADKAEASRFTELRSFLEAQHQQMHAALLARIDHLETRLAARAQESDNTTAAYVGQLEQQLRARGADMHLV
ncbi:Mg2+/citrate symporter [Acidovorax soli]|jgi:Mg2+/citrate symporter|uniref:Mg2+/citrate symporter n=1 Tax=Acidovorax soli TaxID=592050 RepID=A0A7X0UBX5_9BURK|nr:LapA family protein [Acidovorax soli]MBB6562020.1 Mg2+/citrate symporter [Acidovorax soli]